MRICFLIGSADISGGTNVIFEHALALRSSGHDVRIACVFPPETAAPKWHRALETLDVGPFARFSEERFDLAVLTWWRTVLEAPAIRADRTVYFVQSIESRFYPPHDSALRWLVGTTYDRGVPTITITDWLAAHLAARHGVQAQVVRNGIDKSLFRPDGDTVAPRRSGRVRMLAEGALGVPFKNVARTIALAREAGIDDLWLLTPTDVRRVRGVDRVFSRVPLARAAAVYRSCDVLIKLSFVEGMFGPPLEMFHCGGTAVVSDVFGHDEYIVDGGNALVRPLENEASIVEAIGRLRSDRATLDRLRDGARRTADAWPSWAESSRRFVQAIERAARLPAVSTEALRQPSIDAWAEYARREQAAPRRIGGRLRVALRARVASAPPAARRRVAELRAACVDWYRAPDRRAWLGEDGG